MTEVIRYDSLPDVTRSHAREVIASLCARLLLAGHDGVTAREVVHALRSVTSRSLRKRLNEALDESSSLTENSRELEIDEAFVESALHACASTGDWFVREPIERETSGSMSALAEVVFDLPGREFRPGSTWLGTRKGGNLKQRVRKPHSSVREVLKMCRGVNSNGSEGNANVSGKLSLTLSHEAGTEAISPPRKREAVKTNPLMKAVVAAVKVDLTKETKKRLKAKRKFDTANEKAGNHLALVNWIGQGMQCDVQPWRTYYAGLNYNGEIYMKGDPIYCLPAKANEEMYIAQLESLFEDSTGKWMECCWFMTQKETEGYGGIIPADSLENEIYLGAVCDVNAINSLEGKAPIFPFESIIVEDDQNKEPRIESKQVLEHQEEVSSPPPARKRSTVEKKLYARRMFVPAKRNFNPLFWKKNRGFWWVAPTPPMKATKKRGRR